MKKSILVFVTILVAIIACVSFVACDGDTNNADRYRDGVESLTFTAPEGTPALAMLRLVEDNKTIDGTSVNYQVVKPANIAVEMSSKKSDIVIMPVNAGANLIRQGADYKLVSIAVDGSLYMVGKNANGGVITMDDVKGKKIACIGQTGVPGLVFRYVMKANNIEIVDESTTPGENQVSVQYVADGSAGAVLLGDGRVDFMVVGEPAATAQTNRLGLNAEMNMQTEYAKVSGENNYPQAGLFVRCGLCEDNSFMGALFEALSASKAWVGVHASSVSEFASAHLYDGAVFPLKAVGRCAVNATKLDDEQKGQVITFLEKVMPKDSQGNAIDWQSAKVLIF